MARIGLLKPRIAKYAESSGTVTYSNGQILAKAIEHELTLENSEPVILYADDGAAESVGGFSSGTLTITIDELPIETAGLILGMTVTTIESPTAGASVSFDDDTNPPYLGYGVIVPKIRNNTRTWMAVLLTKVKFSVPGDAYNTKGETVEFGTPELTATVMRDDTAKHAWRKWAEFGTEEAANTWLNTQLSIS